MSALARHCFLTNQQVPLHQGGVLDLRRAFHHYPMLNRSSFVFFNCGLCVLEEHFIEFPHRAGLSFTLQRPVFSHHHFIDFKYLPTCCPWKFGLRQCVPCLLKEYFFKLQLTHHWEYLFLGLQPLVDGTLFF